MKKLRESRNQKPRLYMGEEAKRYAVVTGANKGIGYGISKKLATRGVKVILTARDEKRGLEALENLKQEIGVSSHSVMFHQLDVTDPSSIATLTYFITTTFGKLDILINNAGVSPGTVNGEALFRKVSGEEIEWDEIVKCNMEMSRQCIETNYFGAVRVTEALLPLLHLSFSPTIVNVTSLASLIKVLSLETSARCRPDLLWMHMIGGPNCFLIFAKEKSMKCCDLCPNLPTRHKERNQERDAN